jgi:Phage capsid family
MQLYDRFQMNPIVAAGNADQRAKAHEFEAIARYLVKARGDKMEARELAAPRATERIKTILKSAVSAGGVGIGTWGSQLAEYEGLVAAWLDSLVNAGAFDAMRPSMKMVPLHTRVSVVTTGASGTTVGESQITPISSMTLAGHQLAIYKALAIVIVTDELLKIADPATNALFGNELRNAVAVETDRQFLALITSGISPIASSGATAANVLFDIDAALTALATDAASKLFIIAEPETTKKWVLRTTADGALAFPGMTPQEGVIAGTQVLVSDGVANNTFVVVDANQIAASAGTIELSASNQALLEFQTTPASPPAAGQLLQSLWQQNETGLLALRFFGAERLRDTGVAVIGNLNYTGNSPA